MFAHTFKRVHTRFNNLNREKRRDHLQIVDRHDGVGEEATRYSEDHRSFLPKLRVRANELWLENDVEVTARRGEIIVPRRENEYKWDDHKMDR